MDIHIRERAVYFPHSPSYLLPWHSYFLHWPSYLGTVNSLISQYFLTSDYCYSQILQKNIISSLCVSSYIDPFCSVLRYQYDMFQMKLGMSSAYETSQLALEYSTPDSKILVYNRLCQFALQVATLFIIIIIITICNHHLHLQSSPSVIIIICNHHHL
jgi:hypothetical protein